MTAATPATQRASRLLRHLLVSLLITSFAGCAEELVTNYGERGGLTGHESVNGTGVLGELFKQSGHRVGSWHRLSPRLWDRADVIVWFPRDFDQPSDEAVEWLERWLRNEPGQTLIFVGRDFDAAAGYWKHVAPGAPPKLAAEIARLQAEARSDFLIDRAALPDREDWGWFTMEGKLKHRSVRTLRGAPRWTTGVDPSKLEIELHGRVVPPQVNWDGGTVEVLLESEGDALVSRLDFDGSQLIVVANGSFLLNLPLVNHEHRKLAASLVREVGEQKNVVFLETSSNPTISDEDPTFTMPTGLELLGIKPFNQILLHFAVLGIIFCFARLPLFGRPREAEPPQLSDFGQHITSLGELLASTGDREYAWQRLAHYQQFVRREAGGARSHAPAHVPESLAPSTAEIPSPLETDKPV